ncbi:MAG: hypothetical protein IPK28_06950 [Devosia sp.]|nr:hypothetical protein [Devosia sp.]
MRRTRDEIVRLWTGRIDGTLLNAAMPNVHGAAGFLILALVGASSSLQEGRAGASILLQVPLVVDHHIVMRAGDGCARAPAALNAGPQVHLAVRATTTGKHCT